MAEMLVVRSKVKAYAAKRKMRLGGDAVSALSMEVERLVDRAAERATAAKAGTIKAKHI